MPWCGMYHYALSVLLFPLSSDSLSPACQLWMSGTSDQVDYLVWIFFLNSLVSSWSLLYYLEEWHRVTPEVMGLVSLSINFIKTWSSYETSLSVFPITLTKLGLRFCELLFIQFFQHCFDINIFFYFVLHNKVMTSNLVSPSLLDCCLDAWELSIYVISSRYWPNNAPTKDCFNWKWSIILAWNDCNWFKSPCEICSNQQLKVRIWSSWLTWSAICDKCFHLLIFQEVATSLEWNRIFLFPTTCTVYEKKPGSHEW